LAEGEWAAAGGWAGEAVVAAVAAAAEWVAGEWAEGEWAAVGGWKVAADLVAGLAGALEVAGELVVPVADLGDLRQ